MIKLSEQRCYNHGFREAAARCPECGRFFCRECITEHEDRVLCSACLVRTRDPGESRPSPMSRLAPLFHGVTGIMLMWLFFYLMGQVLLSIPSSYHDGSIWETMGGGGG
ncbi:MAG: rhomboid family protein [Desulfobacterales bacterium]|nr:rhomboid family protein [Desulfobacterales bacterium]